MRIEISEGGTMIRIVCKYAQGEGGIGHWYSRRGVASIQWGGALYFAIGAYADDARSGDSLDAFASLERERVYRASVVVG